MVDSMSSPSGEAANDHAPLTAREEQVLALVAEGNTNAQVAAGLGIATRTVGKHLEHVYEKLDRHTRAGAVSSWLGRT
jgi:DNA-binding CsgD family transcriptional regulator